MLFLIVFYQIGFAVNKNAPLMIKMLYLNKRKRFLLKNIHHNIYFFDS